MPVYQLDNDLWFPHPSLADAETGLLAVGGDLSRERLLLAYSNGIFPWYEEQGEVFWFSPQERMVMFPSELKISKSMKALLNKNAFEVTFNRDFQTVIEHCAKVKREGQKDTWISENFVDAYCHMHELGFAHSVEVWQNGNLVGGLYGMILGKVFFGESMFSNVSNASKYGFIKLVEHLQNQHFQLIDCQVYTPHLASLGAKLISGEKFQELLIASIAA